MKTKIKYTYKDGKHLLMPPSKNKRLHHYALISVSPCVFVQMFSFNRKESKIPLALMGVCAPRLHMLDGSTRPPINTSGNFSMYVSAESPLNAHLCYLGPHAKFQNPRTTFKYTPPVRPNMS